MARTQKNTRGHRRQTVRILVDYQYEDGARRDYATTLGAGGLFIECEEPLPEGSVLKLRFRLPHRAKLHELEGRVTWQRGAESGDSSQAPGMGVRFTEAAAAATLARELDQLE